MAEKQKVHFLQTEKGYQMLTSTTYNPNEHEVINEVVEEIEKSILDKILKQPWQEVRQYIKNKIELGIQKKN